MSARLRPGWRRTAALIQNQTPRPGGSPRGTRARTFRAWLSSPHHRASTPLTAPDPRAAPRPPKAPEAPARGLLCPGRLHRAEAPQGTGAPRGRDTRGAARGRRELGRCRRSRAGEGAGGGSGPSAAAHLRLAQRRFSWAPPSRPPRPPSASRARSSAATAAASGQNSSRSSAERPRERERDGAGAPRRHRAGGCRCENAGAFDSRAGAPAPFAGGLPYAGEEPAEAWPEPAPGAAGAVLAPPAAAAPGRPGRLRGGREKRGAASLPPL